MYRSTHYPRHAEGYVSRDHFGFHYTLNRVGNAGQPAQIMTFFIITLTEQKYKLFVILFLSFAHQL